MRKTLAFVALAALVALWTLTAHAIYGAHPLPTRIPTHFDAAGNVNGWGEPRMLWLLPIIATVIAGLMTLVSYYPQAFNFPVRTTPDLRPRLEAISMGMIAWLRAEIVCLFLWLQRAIVQSARSGRNVLSPHLLPLVIVAVFVTIIVHFVAMMRAARGARI